MAKLKSHTDRYGVTHPDAVWYPDEIVVRHSARYARIVFRGWHDLAALAAGHESLAGAEKVYEVSGAAYLAIAADLLGPISVAAYAHAAATADSPDPTDTTFSAEGRNQRHVAFFTGCADVTI